jgi:SanA protein
MKYLRAVRYTLRIVLLLFVLVVFLSHAIVRNAAEGRIYTDRFTVPRRPAGLLLGTSPHFRTGAPNQFFQNRIDAAASLVLDDRIQVIVVSGDNQHLSYNEPAYMRAALMERGVPADRIVMDFAGFRTLDSVVRMKEVFGQDDFIIVSQRFQIERALFIAGEHGIHALGFAADDAAFTAQTNVRIREFAARIQALMDVYILKTAPRFLGDPVTIEFPQ